MHIYVCIFNLIYVNVKQEEEGVLIEVVIMDLVELLQVLVRQDLILDLGMMDLIEDMGNILFQGGNHFLQKKPLIDHLVEGTMMTLMVMRKVHKG